MDNEQFAPGIAYELGAAVGLIKFAYEQHPEVRDRLLARLSPDHQELVGIYQAVSNAQ